MIPYEGAKHQQQFYRTASRRPCSKKRTVTSRIWNRLFRGTLCRLLRDRNLQETGFHPLAQMESTGSARYERGRG
jgi:hypothetical protein